MNKKDSSIRKTKLVKVLNKIRPLLQTHGGDVELVEFDQARGIVRVKLTGGCAHCPMAQITLKQGIERLLKREFSEIKKVESVAKDEIHR